MSELQTVFHELLKAWFLFVENWGYFGVFVLMALESSIVPVPSEIVMPPAAYWAAQGRMDFWGVVAAGTAGSYVGSVLSYFGAQWLGGPFLDRFGKYILLSPSKIKMAEKWVAKYGVGGIFLARLLPVVRHLISMPAGIFRMNFKRFSLATVIGAGIWCLVLSWFGQKVIGDSPELLSSPEALSLVVKQKLSWFVLGVVALGAAYGAVVALKRK
jgi:membrane protein DedA with SNARE-associated domain